MTVLSGLVKKFHARFHYALLSQVGVAFMTAASKEQSSMPDPFHHFGTSAANCQQMMPMM